MVKDAVDDKLNVITGSGETTLRLEIASDTPTAMAGDAIHLTTTFSSADGLVGYPENGSPVVISAEIPQETTYVAGSATSQVDALEARSRQVVSRLKYMMAYADLQNAYGRILNSVGAHRPPEDIESLDVAALSDEVRTWLDRWEPKQGALVVASY